MLHRLQVTATPKKIQALYRQLQSDLARGREILSLWQQLSKGKANASGDSLESSEPPFFTRWTKELHRLKAGFAKLGREAREAGRILSQRANPLHAGFLMPLEKKEIELISRTRADLIRCLPLLFIIIAPGTPVTLPLFVKKFPWLLPSPFQHQAGEHGTVTLPFSPKFEPHDKFEETKQKLRAILLNSLSNAGHDASESSCAVGVHTH